MRIDLKSIPAGLCAGYSVRDRNEEIHFAVLRDGRIRTTRVTAPTNHFFKNRNGTQPSILGWTPGLPSDAEYIGHYPENLCRPLEAREDEDLTT